ncbi:unnamed protein product [Cyclocybe aegerita]|uniref:FAD-binding domain-containing protein n=1 Tax=Cyclocybe aegerita TaxID=1973307 RepID=A0A8S0XWL3_CYCAE|nr:unnamed protein product [Cyclocybe aegerita]
MYKLPGGTEVLKEIERVEFEPTPSCPYVNFRQLGQDSLGRILQAEIQKYGCAVELGVELLSVEQSDVYAKVKILKYPGGVEPTQQDMTYKWVIGADGAKSIVRKQLGLAFLGEATEENMVVGDIRIEGLSEDRIHVWGDLSSTMTAIRPSETPGVFTIIAGGPKFANPETICDDEAALKEALRQSTGNRSDIKFGEIICMNHYRPQIRMVNEFRKGRVFVTGDAGHVHSPAGGQGMNTGIQDSFNLGWKLALVAKQLAPPSLLNTYSEERLPVVAEMLNITTSILKKTIKNFNDEVGWNRSGNIYQLGVNYRWSSIVVDESKPSEAGSTYDGKAEDLRAGDRVPDVPGLVPLGASSTGIAMRLFDSLSTSMHTVLIFDTQTEGYEAFLQKVTQYPQGLIQMILVVGKEQEQKIDVANPHPVRAFKDRDNYGSDAFLGGKNDGKFGVFIIRPDRVLGARVQTPEALESYFQGVFGKME